MMYVTDLHGEKIKITDLQGAISQVTMFLDYFDSDDQFRDFTAVQKKYWKDMLQKLQVLSQLN